MSLKINQENTIENGVIAVIVSECNATLNQLRKYTQKNPHEVVHEIRKSFKKVRAALRLVRKQSNFYKQENIYFRDLGRKISDIRDASSVIEVLDLIYAQSDKQLYKNTFDNFQKFLEKRKVKKAKIAFENEELLEKIKNSLTKKYPSVKSLPVRVDSFEHIGPNIEKVYERGQKAYIKSKQTNHPDNFHEWRKRVKYLRYQLIMLKRIRPVVFGAWEKELHQLSNYLGTDRDLYLLKGLTQVHSKEFKNKQSHYLLLTLIEGHRIQLQQHALLLGQNFYNLSKDKFTLQIETAWNTYEKYKENKLVDMDLLKI